MALPFLLYCSEPAVDLYELSDGRFQLIQQGPIAPLMTGYRYLLAEAPLVDFLQRLPIERVQYKPAVLFNRGTGEEHRTHSRIVAGQFFRHSDIRDLALDGMRILTMNDDCFFVSAELKNALEDGPFPYLQFSEGLSGFVGG